MMPNIAHQRLGATTFSAASLILSIAVFGIVMSALAILMAYRATSGTPASQPLLTDETYQLNSCIETTFKTLKVSNPDVDSFNEVWRLCDDQIFNIDELIDYRIRKEKFTRQELDERVILILVVAITISGVFLAGLQLLGSYKLASRGLGNTRAESALPAESASANEATAVRFAEESSIALERDKISLKSSVTGLMILIISLMFFFVYVEWVYMITDIGSKPTPDMKAGLPSDFNSARTKQFDAIGGFSTPPQWLNMGGGIGAPPASMITKAASVGFSSTSQTALVRAIRTILSSTSPASRAHLSTRKMSQK